MACQIGIYAEPGEDLDGWHALVHVKDRWSPRAMLRAIVPLLRHLQTRNPKWDAGATGAWLAWHLINSSPKAGSDPSRVSVRREICSDINLFYRVDPERVQVYRVDELLTWRLIASADLSQESETLPQARGSGP